MSLKFQKGCPTELEIVDGQLQVDNTAVDSGTISVRATETTDKEHIVAGTACTYAPELYIGQDLMGDAYSSQEATDSKTVKIGGVPGGLTPAQVKTMCEGSTSKLIDMLLYPDADATLSVPSLSLKWDTTPTLAELGSYIKLNADGKIEYYAIKDGETTKYTLTDTQNLGSVSYSTIISTGARADNANVLKTPTATTYKLGTDAISTTNVELIAGSNKIDATYTGTRVFDNKPADDETTPNGTNYPVTKKGVTMTCDDVKTADGKTSLNVYKATETGKTNNVTASTTLKTALPAYVGFYECGEGAITFNDTFNNALLTKLKTNEITNATGKYILVEGDIEYDIEAINADKSGFGQCFAILPKKYTSVQSTVMNSAVVWVNKSTIEIQVNDNCKEEYNIWMRAGAAYTMKKGETNPEPFSAK